jgi:hypothetical protein
MEATMDKSKINQNVEINRIWQMPNKHTFSIKPIGNLLDKYIDKKDIETDGSFVSIDPFANKNQYAQITNDLDPQYNTTKNMDATEFLNTFEDDSVDIILYDPPYSTRQVSEVYKKFGMTVNMQTTQNTYWVKQKQAIARIAKEGAYVITCGWNSGGIGKTLGFEIQEILLVPHGGWHNDTIITVEKKLANPQGSFL